MNHADGIISMTQAYAIRPLS